MALTRFVPPRQREVSAAGDGASMPITQLTLPAGALDDADAVTVLGDPIPPPLRRFRVGALLVGLPVAWATLLLFHPTGEGDLVFPIISDQLGRWQAVHIGMVLFIPLMAYAVRTLTLGVDNLAARVGRALLPIGAVLYGVYEALVGIGTGALVAEVDDLSAADHAAGAALVEDFMRSPVFRLFEYSGSLALAGGVVATAIGLRHIRAISRTALGLLVLAAPLITMHVPPFGPVGLTFFVLAVLLSRHRLLPAATDG
jgi:hypothetical protein